MQFDGVRCSEVLTASSHNSVCKAFDPWQARERQFISLKHRVKIISEVSPLSSFSKRFYRACAWAWREYFFLSTDEDGVLPQEGKSELLWAISRPSSKSYGCTVDSADPMVFQNALTSAELEHLEVYKATSPGQVFQLNQNPASGFGSTSTPWALATLIRNCGLLYCDGLNRWMFPTELLATQGFPVVPKIFNLEHPDLPKLCSFNYERESRSGRHMGFQAGNSMHTFPMTVLQLHCMIGLKHQKIPDS